MTDGSKKAFWKKGDNTKLPGRPQQVHRVQELISDGKAHSPVQGHGQSLGGGANRPRSKTFEEYEKETSDIWNDGEEDLANLTLEAELDFAPEREGMAEGGGGGEGQARRGAGQSQLKTKGKAGELKQFFTEVVRPKASPRLRPRSQSDRSRQKAMSLTEQAMRHLGEVEAFDPLDRETARLQKFGKLLAGPNTDLDELRKLSWSGIPSPVRATTWQLLCGYLPANIDRREETLQRKRQEYQNFIQQYYPSREEPIHISTFRQISIDVPRMNPEIPLFQQRIVQECFERILFIWSMRHPASGYVQGINDLVTPFFVIFLSYYISGDKNPEMYEVSQLSEDTLKMLEADSFWCLMKLMEGIQDNYTLAQPGIQTKIMALQDLIKRLDTSLHAHLTSNSIEFIQFAFRWMNNLLMREFPLRCIVRLWDSYLSEKDGFATFHVYVCAALLAHFSEQIRSKKDFQDIMMFLQNLPTANWKNENIEMLLAEAYQLKYLFNDAPGHLTVQRTS